MYRSLWGPVMELPGGDSGPKAADEVNVGGGKPLACPALPWFAPHGPTCYSCLRHDVQGDDGLGTRYSLHCQERVALRKGSHACRWGPRQRLRKLAHTQAQVHAQALTQRRYRILSLRFLAHDNPNTLHHTAICSERAQTELA